jgi:hypothetical protein
MEDAQKGRRKGLVASPKRGETQGEEREWSQKLWDAYTSFVLVVFNLSASCSHQSSPLALPTTCHEW